MRKIELIYRKKKKKKKKKKEVFVTELHWSKKKIDQGAALLVHFPKKFFLTDFQNFCVKNFQIHFLLSKVLKTVTSAHSAALLFPPTHYSTSYTSYTPQTKLRNKCFSEIFQKTHIHLHFVYAKKGYQIQFQENENT